MSDPGARKGELQLNPIWMVPLVGEAPSPRPSPPLRGRKGDFSAGADRGVDGAF
ncbi:hypothetical protein FHS01_001052 [Longimicrobium terrae]|uniref:Uncharacterized protein n=1 Tax=Longimicrobium terrae TaxID=1639882 RepID=A0A841GX61_9BACT|nr:hypothetical protein [Longimicrobium terrae]MBB6069436.1 hypothetical protein [Longimicrobium terrae]